MAPGRASPGSVEAPPGGWGAGENPEPGSAAGVVQAALRMDRSQSLAPGSGLSLPESQVTCLLNGGGGVEGDEDLQSAWVPLGKGCGPCHST